MMLQNLPTTALLHFDDDAIHTTYGNLTMIQEETRFRPGVLPFRNLLFVGNP